MFITSTGIFALTLVTALIFLVVLHRVLDRMKLTKGAALIILLLMLSGFFIPPVNLGGMVSVTVGGALIPLGICIYLLVTADTPQEKGRAMATALLTAIIVYLTDKLFSIRPGTGFDIDPLLLPALVAGITAYLFGRSRRSAFIGGVMGVILLDVLGAVEILTKGYPPTRIVIGGGGVFGAVVIAGMLAVLLAEVVGEIRERLQGGPGSEKIL